MHSEGFTLLELTMGVAVLGMCVVLTAGSIVSVFEALVSVSDARDLCDEAVAAMWRMAAEIKEAEDIVLVGETELQITKSHPASDGYTEVVFYLNGSTLYRRGEPGGSAAVLAQNVDEFEVTYDGDGNNLVMLKIEMVGAGGEEFKMSMDIYPMNLKDVESKNFYNDDQEAGDWELVIES